MENVWETAHAGKALTLGQNVKKFRKALGWTQTDLADRLRALGVEMHQTTVAKLENGTRPTAVHEIWALAKVLDVVYDALLPAVRDEVPERLMRFYELQARVAKAGHERESLVQALELATERLQRANDELDQAVEEARARKARKANVVDQEEG